MKRKTKDQKGITLIALIITIIVLLILAVVTISAVTGDGIINHAENARDAYRRGMEAENSVLKTYEDYLAAASGKASGSNTEDPNSLVAKFKAGELKVGDYVDYRPTPVATAYDPDNGTVGSRTGYSIAQSFTTEQLYWQVMGYDATKNEILLIASTPTTQGLTLNGHVGYNNGEDVLKDTCAALYSNSTLGATARSITMNDIDTYLGGSAYNKTDYGGGSSSDGGYGYQREFTNINTPTDWKGKSGNTNLGEWSGILTATYYRYSVRNVVTDITKQNLILGKNGVNGFYYWVISRALYVDSGMNPSWGIASVIEGNVCNYYDVGLCYSNGDEDSYEHCLRPVVSLSSKVTIEQMPKLETEPTEDWNDPLGRY